jgi:acyl dehydratase
VAKLFYEDVQVGTEIPDLVKHPTTTQLVKWAGATQDPARIHYDKDYAQSAKLPGQIIHGFLKCQWLIQMLTDWIGDDGNIKKINCRYLGMDLPGDTVTCKGKITKKYIQDGDHCVECDIWLGNQREDKTTAGSAIITLPSNEELLTFNRII